MNNTDDKLHQVVTRQLTRLKLTEDDISPEKKKQWSDFLKRVSNSLYDAEQERYLIEQAMNISSKEMMELNDKLEFAQEIAHLGYWSYDDKANRLMWSKEMFELSGRDKTKNVPSMDEIMACIHPKSQKQFSDLMRQAVLEGESFEVEIQFKNMLDGKYYWHNCICHCQMTTIEGSLDSSPRIILSGVVIDITKRKHEEIRRALLQKVTDILASNNYFNIAAPDILQVIVEDLELQVGELWTIEKDSNTLRNNAIWSHGGDSKVTQFIEISKKMTFPPNVGLVGSVWTQKQIIQMLEVEKDSNFTRYSYAKMANLNSGIALPLLCETKVLGVIGFYSHNSFYFDEEVTGLLTEISNQIGLFLEREQNQNRIALLSRQAGMADVATSILHNIGNILNSATTSITIVQEKLQQPYLKKLVSTCELIKDHLVPRDTYLTSNPKGKKIPEYLVALSQELAQDNEGTQVEIDNIENHLKHIKEIVMLQQEFSGIYGLKDKIILSELVDLSIQMSGAATEGPVDITINKDHQYADQISIDKSKTMQILINLLSNAKDSVLSTHQTAKIITISTEKVSDIAVEVRVQDNGLGIEKKDLTAIFAFGYTTKKNGHGFGLHTSALYAKQLGGSLRVESKGEGRGATFILQLPISAVASGKVHQNESSRLAMQVA